jgi:hypothetical protein
MFKGFVKNPSRRSFGVVGAAQTGSQALGAFHKPKTIYCAGADLLLVGKGFSTYRVV